LISERGDLAEFAMDRQLAAQVAEDLERQLSEASNEDRKLSRSSHHDRFLLSPPPALGTLAVPRADVFFAFDEVPRVRVQQETDRIRLGMWSGEATLNITMQGGVAVAVWKFLARAGRLR
jgi:hypothetical protein